MQKHVGRPSNEEVRSEKNKKILIVGIIIVAILAVVGVFEIGNFSNLMGNSVANDSEYTCDSGYTLRKKSNGYECYRELTEKAYRIGDVDRDNKITTSDATLVREYVSGIKLLDDYQILLGDVDGDGATTITDFSLLNNYAVEYRAGSSAPINKIGNYICRAGYKKFRSYCKKDDIIAAKKKNSNNISNENNGKIIYGDVNSDGIVDVTDKTILSGYISDIAGYELNEAELKAADLNLDGKVNISDYTILEGYFEGEITELPHPSQLFGDINFDGLVDVTDQTLLDLYVGNSTKNNLSDAQKHVADLNLDGLVDATDQTIMQQYINGSITKLPYIK